MKNYSNASTPKLIKKAEKVFNEFIRLRDSDDNGNFICVSCGNTFGRYECEAGHYFPKTISIVRFDDRNVNAECHGCNCHDPNHLIGYKKNIIEKIGIHDFGSLVNKSSIGKNNFKWDRFELIELIEDYSEKSKQLRKTKNY